MQQQINSKCQSSKVKIGFIHLHYIACAEATIDRRHRVIQLLTTNYITTQCIYIDISLAYIDHHEMVVVDHIHYYM